VIVLDGPNDVRAGTYPSCCVLRAAVPDQYLGGVSGRDDVGYPVDVVFQDNRGVNETLLRKWGLWRERGERAFRNQRVPGVTEVYTCEIETVRFSPTRDANGQLPAAYQSPATGFTVRAKSREVRGIQV
jgi:hypothetical protein